MWTLAQLQAGKPLKAADIARQFETTIRTAYRDLDLLRDDWRLPLEFDRHKGTYFLTEPTAPLAPLSLSRGELVALFFAEKVLRQYRGTPFEKDLVAAFGKLQELLGEPVSVDLGTLDDFLSLDMGPVQAPDAAVFAAVLSSLRLRRTALVRYHSLGSNRTTDRRIRPYHVFNLRGDWYVAAWDERRREVRDFALHRIRRVTPTTESYEVPPTFDFRKYAGDAFSIEKGRTPVEVAIRFHPRQARWIRERKWHPTARIQEQLDGGCVLRLRVAGLGEVKRWLMQFGSEAEVLAPATLRKEVVRDLSAALGRYRHRSAPAPKPPPRRRGPPPSVHRRIEGHSRPWH